MAADATGGRAHTARAVAVPARIRVRACVFEYRSGDAGLNQSTFCLLCIFAKFGMLCKPSSRDSTPKFELGPTLSISVRSFSCAPRGARGATAECARAVSLGAPPDPGGVPGQAGAGRTPAEREERAGRGAAGAPRTTRRRRAPCAAHSGWQKRGEADFLVRLPRVGVFSRVPACGGADTCGRLGQKDRLGSLGRARNGGLARVCRAHWLERR